MLSTVINNPHIVWTTLQNLAQKYNVRVEAAGSKVILRANCAENLVRILSRIRTLQGA